ncbi:MAG TPA: heme-binding protein [Candidatus Dormibacteraeota bacterium]|nr:heme-binding protein [Candidatus Dormibacteraeota bacterium]
MATVPRLRKPVASTTVLTKRKRMLTVGIVLMLAIAGVLAYLLAGCGGGSTATLPPPPPPVTFQALSASEVTSIATSAAASVSTDTLVIAVVDRQGKVLGVFHKAGAPAAALSLGNFSSMENADDVAVELARTGAFFSNNQAPLTSRTVRFISGIHLPPGVMNQPPADLYGIENTNRGCTLSAELQTHGFLPSHPVSGTKPLGIITGKKDTNDSDPTVVNPGGIPIYRGNVLVGGIGVTGGTMDVDEYAAFVGATSNGFGGFFGNLPPPGAVFLGGVVLPAVTNTTPPGGIGTGTAVGGTWVIAATNGTGTPEFGDLVAPAAGPVGGLSAADVKGILDNAENEAKLTRAAIRLPDGSRARMVIAVADLDGKIIGLRRMDDATVFSIDVAATKARNMVYFNSSARSAADLNGVPLGTAVTNRTISFGSQPLFPPGIDDSTISPGPFFNLYLNDTANPCSQGLGSGLPSGNNSGIVFFPGSAGLYKNGALVGGLGVSGDGVDQDDFVTSAGTKGFEAPDAMRADQILIEGVRLPYFKFPRNPTN